MNLLKQGKTNWKYILILLILATIVGGGVLWWVKKQEVSISELPEIQKPKEVSENKEECLKGKLEGKIMEKITDESLQDIIIQHVIEELEYLSKEELCKAQSFSVSGKEVHLNEDKTPEYIVFPECLRMESGPSCVRGASGNGSIYVFGFIQGEWKLIGNLGGNWVEEIKTRRTKEYLNLATHWHMSAASGSIEEYAWNGEVYEVIKTTEYGPSTQYELGPPEEYLELELWEE